MLDSMDDIYGKKVMEIMERDDLIESLARQKAKIELAPRYKKRLMKTYMHIIKAMHDIENSRLHQEVMNTIARLRCQGVDFENGVKRAVKMKGRLFDELLKAYDDEGTSESESESESDI